jgi:hypothetical protein
MDLYDSKRQRLLLLPLLVHDAASRHAGETPGSSANNAANVQRLFVWGAYADGRQYGVISEIHWLRGHLADFFSYL